MVSDDRNPLNLFFITLLRIAPETSFKRRLAHSVSMNTGHNILVNPTEPPIIRKKLRRELATARSAFLEWASKATKPAIPTSVNASQTSASSQIENLRWNAPPIPTPWRNPMTQIAQTGVVLVYMVCKAAPIVHMKLEVMIVGL